MKGKIACVIFGFAFSVGCIFLGVWQKINYDDMTSHCTAEVKGTVEEEFYFDFNTKKMPRSAETKYVSGRGPSARFGHRLSLGRHLGTSWLIHIVVQTDDLFKLEDIYADAKAEKEGETVSIYYDPDNPDNYYLGSRVDEYKDADVFCYTIGGLFFVFDVFTAIFVYRQSKAMKTQEA